MTTRSQRRTVSPALLLVASLLVGCKAAPAASTSRGEMTTAKPAIEPEEVTALVVPSTLRLTGTLRASLETDLAANATGRVTHTAVERGTRVVAGQVLAKVDVRALMLSAKEAEAQALSVQAQTEQARAECARYEQLRQKGAISELEYDQKMSQCRVLPFSAEAASARASLAAQNVGDGIIRAPFSGIVSQRFVEVGQYVRPDTRVVSIVSGEPLRLEVAVPEAHVGKVLVGAKLSFQVAAYPEREFAGTVRFRSGALDPRTRDLVVEAVIEDPERLLLPGMFADVRVDVGTRSLPSVPRSALTFVDGRAHAFVVKDGRLEERVLALGPSVGERVSVQKGVALGERVVGSSVEGLQNGQRVR